MNGEKIIDEVREGFKGEADRLGLKDEKDVSELIKEVRKENLKILTYKEKLNNILDELPEEFCNKILDYARYVEFSYFTNKL